MSTHPHVTSSKLASEFQSNFGFSVEARNSAVQLIFVHLMFNKIPVLHEARTEIYLISQTPARHSYITQYFRQIGTTFVFILPRASRKLALSNSCGHLPQNVGPVSYKTF
jgi:hypothetical protein